MSNSPAPVSRSVMVIGNDTLEKGIPYYLVVTISLIASVLVSVK